MAWGRSNAMQKSVVQDTSWTPDPIVPATIDWERLVVVDFETYFDDQYTLRKQSTSEYVRDARFKAQMVGIKVGSKATKYAPANRIESLLRSVPWATHSMLAHHAQFDGFILSERYGVRPAKIYDTLSMARALYSNDIGAGLDEVSQFTGGTGKVKDVLELTRGVLTWPKALYEKMVGYNDVDIAECLRIFKHMLPHFPAEEIDTIDRICRMFTEPVLQVDRPRVEKELQRELAEKKRIMLSFAADAAHIKLSAKEIRELPAQTPEDIAVRQVKKLIGSNAFAGMLEKEGITPPVKVSPAWIKTPKDERDDSKKYVNAFARTDMAFVELQEHMNPRVRELVEARLSVKSTSNETRAGRFLIASRGGAALPAYYKYSAAHTHRLGGGDKNNLQNLKRGGELRRSIKAQKGYSLVVVDSGQIEARTNAWLWDQSDLLDDFRLYDDGKDKDPYCKFGDVIYGRSITKADEQERYIAKTGILALGYQMAWARLQKTLALGIGGPQVFLSEDECKAIVNKYRKKNFRIKNGWKICERIIEQMALGVSGSHKCIAWDKETIYLPNGMTMHYPNLRDNRLVKAVTSKLLTGSADYDVDPDWPDYVYERKDAEVKIYGGLLCENLVQALARIIVIGQSREVAKKHHWVMSTHDEGVFHVKTAQAAKVYDFARAEFKKPPVWAPDLPLNADGGFDTFYSK